MSIGIHLPGGRMVDRDDFSSLRIVGIIHEQLQIHDEFLILATTNLTVEQIKDKAQNASRNKRLSDQEFEEKFVDILAAPDAIFTLLTQVKCPLPPTHTGVFVAAGYSMVLQEKGLDEANKWKDKMEKAIKQNYQEIDTMVAQHYKAHPEVLTQTIQGKPARNPRGYSPAYLPHEQGLPDVISELKRTGLIL